MPALLPVSFAYNIFQRVWASTSWSRGVSSLLRCCLHWGFLSLLPMGTWRPKIQYFYFWNIPPSMHRSCSSLHLPGASDSTLFFRQDCLWQASSEVVCINQLYVELVSSVVLVNSFPSIILCPLPSFFQFNRLVSFFIFTSISFKGYALMLMKDSRNWSYLPFPWGQIQLFNIFLVMYHHYWFSVSSWWYRYNVDLPGPLLILIELLDYFFAKIVYWALYIVFAHLYCLHCSCWWLSLEFVQFLAYFANS